MASKRPHEPHTVGSLLDADKRPRLDLRLLPFDVLMVIFSYFPNRVRLRCLSFVCKRWRTAALRSVTSYIWGDYAFRREGPPFEALMKLMPSITHLTLMVPSTRFMLPDSIRSLALSDYASALAPQHCPNITALSFTANHRFEVPDAAFIHRHCEQVTELTLRVVEDNIFFFVDLSPVNHIDLYSWPKVQTLSLDCYDEHWAQRLIERMPALRSLRLTLPRADNFMRLPQHCLASLRALTFTEEEEPEHIACVACLPKMRKLPALARHHPDCPDRACV